ncbi:MAG TPA: DNA-directed RNA polymerase subunit omega [Candidatus Omnitrophica bacterium]|nr:MAG: DNA-directed RNA polymerase subunit omega [Omnitrophica WOR_2 bacterium GWA2_53_43]HBO96590.1 DNA-directed RNA polymerase subunit omega [Candidatus Omnitrophota bacterium]HCI44550.1 DNA-directed RNA polymerase subunit omega [Candidatus Omnitrophota bacterium]
MEQRSIEELLPHSGGSVYRLVRMAANRATELSDGKPCLIQKPASDKFTTIALEEITQGKIEAKQVADKRTGGLPAGQAGKKASLNGSTSLAIPETILSK